MSLRADDVTFRYPAPPQAVLEQVTIAVEAGRITALIGPSGSGKSTLGRLLAGLLLPESGTVLCDGAPVAARRGRLAPTTALLAQDPLHASDPHLTLAELIALPARLVGRRIDVRAAAAEVGLTEDLLDRRPREVSGGQLQRACLARALAQRPRYLVADEATAHLDAPTAATITSVLTEHADRGLGVLAITHDHALASAWADSIHPIQTLRRADASRRS